MYIFSKNTTIFNLIDIIMKDPDNDIHGFLKSTLPDFITIGDSTTYYFESIKNYMEYKLLNIAELKKIKYYLLDEEFNVVHDNDYPYTRLISKGYLIAADNSSDIIDVNGLINYVFLIDINDINIDTADYEEFLFNNISDRTIISSINEAIIEHLKK